MKPTDEQVNKIARESALSQYGTDTHEEYESTVNGYIMGFNEAISQMQPEWVALSPRSKEVSEKINNTDFNLMRCLFDNGDILGFEDPHPFAEMTHVLFLPQPPTK